MPTSLNLTRLSDHQLLVSARELACQERILNIQIIDHLTEIAARGLHLRHGYSSLFAYAVKELGFSEGAAHYRIQAKKLCADYPEVKQQLEEGTLTLTGAGQLQSAFERHARRQRQRAREERRRESSGVSAAGGAGGVSGLGGPDGAGAAGETTVAAEGAEAGTGATGAGGAAAATGDAEAPGTAGAAETPLSESVKRDLIEQAQGKTTRQIGELIAAVDPELVRSRDRLRPLGGDRWEIKAVIDGECQRGLEELRHLLSHVNPAMEYGELLQRLVADGLVKYDPARRPVRVRQPKNGSAAPPAADGLVDGDPSRRYARVRPQPGSPAATSGVPGSQAALDAQPSGDPHRSVHQPKTAAVAVAPARPTNSESPRHEARPERSSKPQQSPGQGVAAIVTADSETADTHRDRAEFAPAPGTADRDAHQAAPPVEIDRGRTWAQKSDDPQPSSGPHRSVHQPNAAAAAPARPANAKSPRRGAPPEPSSERRQSPGQGVAATVAADSESAGAHRDCAEFAPAPPAPGTAQRGPLYAASPAGTADRSLHQAAPPAGTADRSLHQAAPPAGTADRSLHQAAPPAGTADRSLHQGASPIATVDRGPHQAAPGAEIDRGRTWAPKSDDAQAAGSLRMTRRRARATITRTIPAAVKRHIWLRDRGRCTYRDPESGRCCGSRHLVQIDHVQPYAMGGSASAENLRLLCSAHNRDRATEKRRTRPAH